MNPEQIEAFYSLSRSIRSLFHKLGAAAEALHEGRGITTGMRAVLENVIEHGPMTVPEMARMRPVSRQHIQVLVNDLLELDLVENRDNPAHRRSKLVAPTQKGKKEFAALKKRELAALSRFEIPVSPKALLQADRVLAELIQGFDSSQWRAITNEFSSKK